MWPPQAGLGAPLLPHLGPVPTTCLLGAEKAPSGLGAPTRGANTLSVRGRGGPGLAWDPDWQVPGSPAGAARVAGSAGLLACLAEPTAAVHRWLPGAVGPPEAGVPFPPGEFAQISASPFSETLPRSGPPHTHSRPTRQVHPGQRLEEGVRQALGGAPP